MATVTDFAAGDVVRLGPGVLHQEYAGRVGVVKKIIKSRKEVVVDIEGMQPYYAHPENVAKVSDEPPRMCMIFNCDRMHGNMCCVDCPHRAKCNNPCLNGPDRCGQVKEGI